MRIDFVSDVACPWCAVGLHALEEALRRIGPTLQVELHFQPFELNPQMPPEGEDLVQHLARKYGATREQLAATHATLRQRGEEVGFQFGHRERIWNTFDAHRLLYWAGLEGRQRELKHALLSAYHTHGASARPRCCCGCARGLAWMRRALPRSWPATSSPAKCARPSSGGRRWASARCHR